MAAGQEVVGPRRDFSAGCSGEPRVWGLHAVGRGRTFAGPRGPLDPGDRARRCLGHGRGRGRHPGTLRERRPGRPVHRDHGGRQPRRHGAALRLGDRRVGRVWLGRATDRRRDALRQSCSVDARGVCGDRRHGSRHHDGCWSERARQGARGRRLDDHLQSRSRLRHPRQVARVSDCARSPLGSCHGHGRHVDRGRLRDHGGWRPACVAYEA